MMEIRIRINTENLEYIEVLRTAPTDEMPAPDTECTYLVTRYCRLSIGDPFRKTTAAVQHRYGDGHLVLTSLALASVQGT